MRFYLRNIQVANAPPSGTQSTLSPTAANSGEGFENLALMLNTGLAQTSISISESGTGLKRSFNCRFVTPPLATQHVNAGSMIFGTAAACGSLANAEVCPQIYLWRPSTQSVITRLRDSSTPITLALTTAEAGYVRTMDGTNGGSMPAFDPLDEDVICLEDWYIGTQGTGGTRSRTLWFDGNTDVVDASSPTNAAGFLDFPADLLFFDWLKYYPVGFAQTTSRVQTDPNLRM